MSGVIAVDLKMSGIPLPMADFREVLAVPVDVFLVLDQLVGEPQPYPCSLTASARSSSVRSVKSSLVTLAGSSLRKNVRSSGAIWLTKPPDRECPDRECTPVYTRVRPRCRMCNRKSVVAWPNACRRVAERLGDEKTPVNAFVQHIRTPRLPFADLHRQRMVPQ